MQAVVMRQYGGPEVLGLEECPEPEVPGGWVSVDLHASGLNWHDTLVRRGSYKSPLPHVPGAEGAGVRRDTGEKVIILPTMFWGGRDAAPEPGWGIVGDRCRGTYAERIAVPAECVMPWPAGLGLAEAAVFSLVGVTVYRGLFSRGRLAAGESLLVLGASGGVATTAVSLASAAGARVVVTSGSPEKIDAARGLGAAAGVDHTAPDWVEQARSLTPQGRGFDLVLDSVGRWGESVRCLRPGGRCVVLGASAAEQAEVPIRPFYFGQYELIGTTLGSPADMAGLLSFVREHRIAPAVIDVSYGLGDAAAAHERLEAGTGFGRIVLLHR